MAGVTGVVLAGGGATRFGGAPKGLARVGGVRIVDRVADALREACDALLLVANASDAEGWLPGVRTVADVLPGRGSLGGLHAALTWAGGTVVVVAWDMPFVPAALLRALRDAVARGADAAVPSGPAGDPEPLCAAYGTACLDATERLLATGERRAGALADAVRTARLGTADVARFGDPATMFMNVNTPDDLVRAETVITSDARRGSRLSPG